MEQTTFKDAFIAVFGQEYWDAGMREVEDSLASEREYDAMTDFDHALGEGRR